jgi:hypothetical protein
VRRVAGDARKITAFPSGSRQLCRENKRESVALVRITLQTRGGTAVAQELGMLTLSTFVIAMGSVCMSVFWACKEDTSDHA